MEMTSKLEKRVTTISKLAPPVKTPMATRQTTVPTVMSVLPVKTPTVTQPMAIMGNSEMFALLAKTPTVTRQIRKTTTNAEALF